MLLFGHWTQSSFISNIQFEFRICIFKLFLFIQCYPKKYGTMAFPELGTLWRHLYCRMIQNTMNNEHISVNKYKTLQKNKEELFWPLRIGSKICIFLLFFLLLLSFINLKSILSVVLKENGSFELNMIFILCYIHFCILHNVDLLRSHRRKKKTFNGIL